MAFRTQKISQMTPKGADLEATDLIEVSTIESGSYVTRSITGQELIDAIPPTSVEWGDIGGTLSAQTDLQTALSGKVPTSRTLTINGTTQDLSADRTFTISTGITIGTTAITSGTVGRVLFEGTGNVVQESANLFWDNTNGRLGIGGTPGAFNLDIFGTSRLQGRITTTYSSTTTSGIVGAIGSGTDLFGLSHAAEGFVLWLTSGFTSPNNYASGFGLGLGNPTSSNIKFLASNLTITATNITMPSNNITLGFGGANQHLIYSSTSPFVGFKYTNTGGWNFDLREESTGTQRFVIFGATGNVGLSTTTDAGFRLDVNGTARTGAATIQTLTVGLGTGSQSNNTVLGLDAFTSNTSGNFNVAIGPRALNGNTTGTGNIGIGHFSAVQISNGTNNVAIGREALSNGNSSGNVVVGMQACNVATGSNNVVLGLQAQAGNFNSSVILGRAATADGNNQFVVGSTTHNAGIIDTATVTPDKRWIVKINGVNYYIALQTV